MKWNATNTSDFFFNPHDELTKIVQMFYEILWCQIEPFGTRNWTINIKGVAIVAQLLGFSGTVEENTLQSFCYCRSRLVYSNHALAALACYGEIAG